MGLGAHIINPKDVDIVSFSDWRNTQVGLQTSSKF
jgi:hypothetical protein